MTRTLNCDINILVNTSSHIILCNTH